MKMASKLKNGEFVCWLSDGSKITDTFVDGKLNRLSIFSNEPNVKYINDEFIGIERTNGTNKEYVYTDEHKSMIALMRKAEKLSQR